MRSLLQRGAIRTCARACSVLCSSTAAAPRTRRSSYGIKTEIDFDSLEKFKDIHGHLLVPQTFAFEPNSVPGLGFASSYLGVHVKEIRKTAKIRKSKGKAIFPSSERKKLMEIGFVWNAHDEVFRRTLRGLDQYREIHGDLAVPCKFTVPRDPHWARDLWGMRLGGTFRNLRFNHISGDRMRALREAEIARTKLHQLEGEKVELALQTYRQLYSTPECKTGAEVARLKVSRLFVVPMGDVQWPASVWGMKLGYRAHDIRHKGYYQQSRDTLREVSRLLVDAPYWLKEAAARKNTDIADIV
ncbi:hypothetical protein B484DRAFT_396107 [Ochromonadaceae sp. CCMP2298]|nr:hypothetical protein B484DRAFT_396107 [Ochromonadaceae sp. CCMP2298]